MAHQVDWFLNGKPLSSELVSGNILSLTSEPDLSDAVLSCRAENKAGSTTSSRIIIVKGTKYELVHLYIYSIKYVFAQIVDCKIGINRLIHEDKNI